MPKVMKSSHVFAQKLNKLKREIEECKVRENLYGLTTEFDNLLKKNKKSPKTISSNQNLIDEIKLLISNGISKFAPQDSHANFASNEDIHAEIKIDIERRSHMLAFRLELSAIKVTLKDIHSGEETLKNKKELFQKLNSCADLYVRNQLDLKEFKRSASNLIGLLKEKIKPLVDEPNVYLKNLEDAVAAAPIDPTRQAELITFRTFFSTILAKADKFSADGHHCAARAAKALHQDLSTYAVQYETHQITASDFKASSKIAIDDAHQELDNHRGWKRFLQNLALIVGTLGIGYALGVLYKGSFFVCNPDTDSAKELNSIENEINQMKGG